MPGKPISASVWVTVRCWRRFTECLRYVRHNAV